MNKSKNYQKEFSNYVGIIDEALKRNDFKAYEIVRDLLDESISECKHEKELMKEMDTCNFGILNHIFENELPLLIKTNKKGVKNVIKTIKEDKNLIGEFNFYNVLKNKYTEDISNIVTSSALINELVESIDINKDTLKDSNKKLRKVMMENGIKPSEFVDSESKKLYESGDVILSSKRTPNNVIKLAESYKNVSEYMNAHKKHINESKGLEELVLEFEDKLKETLNESEISFVQQITDFRSPIAEQRKEKLFNSLKNDCILKLNEMLKEDENNAELNSLKVQIDEMSFNRDSIVKDTAKLLEIRDILMDD